MKKLRSHTSTTAIRKGSIAGAALLAGSIMFNGSLADEIFFEDFEGLTLQPFDVADGIGDGTDWTQEIPGWTIDNSGMSSESTELAYNGVSAMDVDSWIDEQGVQLGRGTAGNLGPGTHNTALVFDGDAWADYSGGEAFGFNSYITKEYDLSTADLASLEISFDWEFAAYQSQRGLAQVSFDGGTTWQTILDLDSDTIGDSVLLAGPTTYVSGTDFDATSTTMLLRFGKIDADNDWWFVIDNVQVSDNDGVIDLEDFEGLDLLPFTAANGDGFYGPDGTDYTADITGWAIDNSLMFSESAEGAYNGWAALDVESWIWEQDGQGRSLFEFFGADNTVLVADPDAWEDYALEYDPQGFNSYISTEISLHQYDARTLEIEFYAEFRVEDTQRGVVEVSFDGGNTWQMLLDIDSDSGQYASGDYANQEPALYTAGVDFTGVPSESMILRFGCIEAGNDWWFAIDNIKVSADPLSYPLGDANGDGVFNNADIEAFVLALLDRSTYESTYPDVNPDEVLDFSGDGILANDDIDGFIYALLN